MSSADLLVVSRLLYVGGVDPSREWYTLDLCFVYSGLPHYREDICKGLYGGPARRTCSSQSTSPVQVVIIGGKQTLRRETPQLEFITSGDARPFENKDLIPSVSPTLANWKTSALSATIWGNFKENCGSL